VYIWKAIKTTPPAIYEKKVCDVVSYSFFTYICTYTCTCLIGLVLRCVYRTPALTSVPPKWVGLEPPIFRFRKHTHGPTVHTWLARVLRANARFSWIGCKCAKLLNTTWNFLLTGSVLRCKFLFLWAGLFNHYTHTHINKTIKDKLYKRKRHF
jgi:hypothetical protein